MDEDIYRQRVDTTDVDRLSDKLDDVLRKLEKLASKTIRARPGEIDALNKEREALEKLLKTQRELGVVQSRVSQDVTQSVNVNRTARAAELRDLTTLMRASDSYSEKIARQNALQEEKRDLIEDLIDQGQVLTKSEREIARSMGMIKDKAGSIEEMTDRNFEAWKKLERVQRESVKMIDGVWKKTADFDFLKSGNKAIEKVDAYLDKVERVQRGLYTKVSKPKYVSAGAEQGLPGFESADYFYGRSRADMGIPGKPKTGKAATNVPLSRASLFERVHYMAGELGGRFPGVGGNIKEMAMMPKAEIPLRAITDMFFGAETLKDEERAQLPGWFRSTNPKTGQPYNTRDQHKVHAAWMLRDVFARHGMSKLMPKAELHKWYAELTGTSEPISEKTITKSAKGVDVPKGTVNAAVSAGSYTPSREVVAIMRQAERKRIIALAQRQYARDAQNQEDLFWSEMNKRQEAGDLTEIQKQVAAFTKVGPNAIAAYQTMRPEKRWDVYKEIMGKLRGASKATGMSLYSGSSLSKLFRRMIATVDTEGEGRELMGMDRFSGLPAYRMESAQNAIMNGPVDAKMEALKKLVEPHSRPMTQDEMTEWAKRSDKSLLTPEQIHAAGHPKGASEAELRKFLNKPAPAEKKNNVGGLVVAAAVDNIVKQRQAVNEVAADIIAGQPTEVPTGVMSRALGNMPQIGPQMQMGPIQRENQVAAQRMSENVDYLKELMSTSKLAKTQLAQAEPNIGSIRPDLVAAQKQGPELYQYMQRPWQQLPADMLNQSKAFSEMSKDKLHEFFKVIANILPPGTNLHKFIGNISSFGYRTNLTPQNVLAAANSMNENSFNRTGFSMTPRPQGNVPLRPGWLPHFMGQSPFEEGFTGRMQRMLGVNYKVKLAFTDFRDFTRAQEILKNMPGYIRMTTKELENQDGVEEDVVHQIEMQGKLRSEEEVERVRYGAKYAGSGKSSITEKASLEIDNRRVSMAERLTEYSNRMDRLNWKLVRGQMAMLGMYFSMMSVTNMISRAWSQLGGSISKLETTFQNIGEAIAFGPKTGPAANLIRGMLRDSKNIVGAWKEYKGLTATINTMLAYVAYKIFSDKRVVTAITDLLDKVATKLSDPAFIERIITLVTKIIEAIPTIVDFFMQLVDWLTTISQLPGFSQLVAGLLALGVASAFAMPILAALGSAAELLSGILGALGLVLKPGWLKEGIVAFLAGAKDALVAGFAELSGTGTLGLGAFWASVAAGLLVGFAVVYAMIATGFTQFLAKLGEEVAKAHPVIMNLMKLITLPFGLLGTLIIDLVTLQFANIPKDLARVIAIAITAALELIRNAVAGLPFVGTKLAEQYDKAIAINKAFTASLATTTSVPQAAEGGYVAQSGLAVIHKGEQVVPADQVQTGVTNIYNYNNVVVNNKNDEKYLEDMLGRGYYRQAG